MEKIILINFIIFFNCFLFSSNQDIYKMIDDNQENNNFEIALELSLEFHKNNEYDIEILWRLARGYFDLSDQTLNQELQIECMGNEIHTPFYEMVQRLKAKKGFSYFPDVGKTKTYAEMMKKKMIFPNYSGNKKNKEPIIIKLKKIKKKK